MSGVAEYLFRSRDRIEKAINAGLNDKVFRADDLEFTVAARQWGECVSFGNFDLYERRFMDTASECGCVGFLSASASTCFHCLVCPSLPLCQSPLPRLSCEPRISSRSAVFLTVFATQVSTAYATAGVKRPRRRRWNAVVRARYRVPLGCGLASRARSRASFTSASVGGETLVVCNAILSPTVAAAQHTLPARFWCGTRSGA